MLLTTVVPIIPEYLLRISHPNETDMLLKKVPEPKSHTRDRRQVDWDSDMWDNSWDVPAPGAPIKEQSSKPQRPPGFPKPSKISGGKSRGRMPSSRMRPAEHTTEAPQSSEAYDDELTSAEADRRIGYTVPMFTGFVIMFLSTLLFAFGGAFGTLWMARALQGVGSACTSTSGMGMLAQAYPDDAERGNAMGIALGGLALGVLVGPPYGGLLYQWAGKELPFLLLALLALADGALQCTVLQPKIDRGEPEGTAIKELITDPYIIVAAGSITIGNLGIAMLEPSLPLWMMESWGAGSFERGAAFLPASVSYLLGTNIFGPLAHKIGRWLSGFIGLIIIGFCLLAIPSASSVGGLIVPNFCMGFSIGMIDASMFPLMGHIVDVRHVGVYGSIYAIADAAFCFAFALGPFFSGPMVRSIGFPAMMYLIALINFLYAPLMFFLRKLPETVPPAANGTATVQTEVPPVTTIVDGNALHYEKIDGVTDPGVPQRGNYHYDINTVWDD
ncbi:Protein CAT-1 a [Aphelenchoides avenae]|nr:Protein CAT-1 a [Aphelenchus avenae]